MPPYVTATFQDLLALAGSELRSQTCSRRAKTGPAADDDPAFLPRDPGVDDDALREEVMRLAESADEEKKLDRLERIKARALEMLLKEVEGEGANTGGCSTH